MATPSGAVNKVDLSLGELCSVGVPLLTFYVRLDDIIKLNKRGSARGRGRGRGKGRPQSASGNAARPGGPARQKNTPKGARTWRGQGEGSQGKKKGANQQKQGNQQKVVKQLPKGGDQQGAGGNRRKAQRLRNKARKTLQVKGLQQDAPKGLGVKQRLGIRVSPGSATGTPASNRLGNKLKALK